MANEAQGKAESFVNHEMNTVNSLLNDQARINIILVLYDLGQAPTPG